LNSGKSDLFDRVAIKDGINPENIQFITNLDATLNQEIYINDDKNGINLSILMGKQDTSTGLNGDLTVNRFYKGETEQQGLSVLVGNVGEGDNIYHRGSVSTYQETFASTGLAEFDKFIEFQSPLDGSQSIFASVKGINNGNQDILSISNALTQLTDNINRNNELVDARQVISIAFGDAVEPAEKVLALRDFTQGIESTFSLVMLPNRDEDSPIYLQIQDHRQLNGPGGLSGSTFINMPKSDGSTNFITQTRLTVQANPNNTDLSDGVLMYQNIAQGVELSAGLKDIEGTSYNAYFFYIGGSQIESAVFVIINIYFLI